MHSQLRNMLVKSSPNLEELTITTSFPHPADVVDVYKLAGARWKNLRKLCIGDVVTIDSPPEGSEKHPFVSFLESHPNLKSLQLSRHNLRGSHLTSITSHSLPHLTHFGGTLEQLQDLPHIHPRIKSIAFTDPIFTRIYTPPTIAAVLRKLTALTNLRISFVLHYAYDSTSLLHWLATACPLLECLQLTCVDKPSFQLVSSLSLRSQGD
jgi:hypothetical protein